MNKTVCELFAGVGGFRLGLNKSSNNWNFVWANQWEPSRKTQHAFDCYINHFGESENHVNQDIATIDKSTIPNHSLLVGGFPCQDYSVARTQAKGIEGIKGVLWWQIRDILESKKPPFVLLENVDRLLKSPAKQRGRDFGVILACFNDLGYSVEWRVINAAEYGFPQRRRRVFIFAFRNDTNFFQHLDENNLKDCIHNKGFFQNEFPIERHFDTKHKPSQIQMNYIDLADISDNFKLDFRNTGTMINGTIYTEETKPTKHTDVSLSSILETNVDEQYYIDNNVEKLKKWKYLKGSKKIERTSKAGHTYTFSEGPLSFPDPIEKPARTMLTSESSINRSSHVVKDPTTNRLRIITPIEAERLNGFDDNWTNTGMTQKFRYFCMGNALVVGLVEKMGKSLSNIFEKEANIEHIENYKPIAYAAITAERK
ncbi:MAG: DNA (cytosine-5-)-methyltransferase [Tepidibacter sp.]|jgi:DNA (cytosine-5)-methyltransferase 1|uniref:DNA (cytosine-5-)-methyltransferase n=1 Tax=Tepidibacter sp. TaxID=2529387 RepID=UPI0025E2063B|nr:DNA (cytosine-5-)-methyltransferase [Tepidibacter sp.]MCT4510017.1 DNA (cytosine-5-)-methyltransferase [Tepidibacter sp.]MCT4601163.1 DNA (cytosine-5-)-methyltransferase [Marinifilaceae bacterium]